ncbi:terminase large subunit [Peribacillus frigoritolerans]|uniref:terminase large subunit n=1 Tax=Peribacillus frigoritolerans TaxID=450367 RepID=UPI002E222D03|nr:terminase TerL endonuclease subunit [Peribacillus frigoritolerans]MED4693791.1 terminase large subunit [Peribacillus frigoritolerans]
MTQRAIQYAQDVLSGKEVAGRLVKLSCQRFMDDLDRSKLKVYSEDFPYVFNEERADELLDYAETLVIAEGLETFPLVLAPYQAFIFSNLNGWENRETGFRRFRSSYVQVGRQNGKSLMNGVLGTYYGNFAGYQHGQIYCSATKKKQAMIVVDEMIKFIKADPELEELFKIKEYIGQIDCLNTDSKIMALSRDTKIDGFRPFLGIVDEFHLHPTNEMYKILEGGTGNLKETLISVITTAGFDLNSPCYEMYKYCKRILEGVVTNETRFVYVAELDEEDDMWDSSNWVKANPLTCQTPEGIKLMEDTANEARDTGGENYRDYLTKRLNKWVQFTDNQYMNLEHWKKCESDKTLADYKGQDSWVGLDLSSGGDLTSLSIVIPHKVDGVKKYFVHSHSFMPEKRIAQHIKTDNAPYDIWVRDGLITTTKTLGGIKTDYKYIIEYLKKVIQEYNLRIKMICYDPHNASAFLHDLSELGYPVFEVGQSHKQLNDATCDFKLEVEAKNVLYNKKSALLSWSVANAETVSNSYGEIKIDKNLERKRIDPVDAVIDAWHQAMKVKFNFTQFRGEDAMKKLGW